MSTKSTELIVFNPTDRQRMAKARFWQAMATNWRDPASLSINEITQLAGATSFKKWAVSPDFQAWFLNANEASIKIHAAKELAVDALVDIIRQPIDVKEGVTAPSKVRAAELIMSYGGLEPPKKTETKTTQSIVSDMAPDQLKQFLKTHMKKLILSMDPEDRDDLLDVIAVTESKEPKDV